MSDLPALQIRPAGPEEDAAILAIRNREIREGYALWIEREDTPEGMRAWREARQAQGFPVLAAIAEGRVLGYGTYGPFRASPGYRETVEHSLYVVPEAQGRGLGKALLAALEAEARAQGLHAMVGGIDAENAVSIGLHRALGFVETARMPEVGLKFGSRRTLAFLQKIL